MFGPAGEFFVVFDGLLELALDESVLSVFAGDELRFLGEFEFEGRVLLLVDLVFFDEGLERVDLLVLLGDGGLHAGDELALLLDFGDVVLVVLEFEEEGQFLGEFAHVGWVQIIIGLRRYNYCIID